MSESPHNIATPSGQPTQTAAVIYAADEHPIKRRQIDDDARRIVFRLQQAGFDAYIVGGGVRDLVIGKKPKDFDISTDATPREIKSLFRNCRIIGRRFKLAHIFFSHGKTIEVSTFRDTQAVPEDGDDDETPSPVRDDNVYGTAETDAVRRDLTINALMLDVSTMEIIDYVGGMKDLQEGVVRIIGDPQRRFQEDPVRMIRAVRHSARNGFRIDKPCWDAIVANAQLLAQCPPMRVFDEIRKDLSSGCFLSILSLLGETGLLGHILPELLENNGRLLSAKSDFSLCLERLDEMTLEGHEVSATVVLAVIALFVAGDSISLRDLIESFPSGEEFITQLQNSFTVLSVPRKERERIQFLLSRWLRVHATPLQTLKPGSFKRLSLLDELVTLLTVTCVTRDDIAKVQLLRPLLSEDHHEEAPEETSPESSGRRRRSRRRKKPHA